MILSPELQSKMIAWRAKANDGTLAESEVAEAMKHLRGERMAAATATKTRTAKAKAAIPSADDLLGEIGEEGSS